VNRWVNLDSSDQYLEHCGANVVRGVRPRLMIALKCF
jgi:hypothetical protein